LDLEEFQKLCSIQCTLVEIADWYGCSEATIKKRIKEEPEFEEAWKHGMAHGRISIRRAQMRAVQDPNCKGHATMLVWLGKIFLNQKDSQEVNLNTDNAKHGPYQHPFVTEDEATSTEVPDGESQLH
jgi:predicted transcriptional regulator